MTDVLLMIGSSNCSSVAGRALLMAQRRGDAGVSMANLALGVVPTDEEVHAIKQQLKLLGHSLPTEVIVRFLQENNELLTACHNPTYGLPLSGDPIARSQSASRQPDVQSNTESGVKSRQDTAALESFSQAMQQSGPATPQLDVTWASAGPDGVLTSRTLHSKSRDPLPGPSATEQEPDWTQVAAVRRDRHDQLMCTRDFLSRPHHSALDAGHADRHQDRDSLEHNVHTLSSELDDLAASLRHVSKPAPTRDSVTHGQSSLMTQGQSSLMTQHRPQQRSEPASDMYQQPLRHLSGPVMEGREPLLDASLYRRDLPSRASHPHDAPNKSSFMPDGISGGADMYRQQDAAAESQHAQHDSPPQQYDWKKDDSHSYSRRESSQHGDDCRKPSRGCSPSPGSVLRCSSLRSLPVLNNSFIVPAQAAKPRKVDRVTRHRELQQVWNKDAFLRSGGTAKTSKRRGENFNELYAACHAAEDKLKELTLKHGKAAKGSLKGKQQQENVAPTDKRRDALRWETRMRMQLRDGCH